MRKRLLTLLVATVVLASSTMSAFAENNISITTSPTKATTSILPFKTVDGTEVKIPSNFEELAKGKNIQTKSLSAADFADTKAVADKEASSIAKYYQSTSVQYALIYNGKIVVSGNSGVYSQETNKPVTADTMYGIGSVSKMFVTTAVMKLVDQGKVKLDAPVTQYIKDFKMADSRYKKITVRMLLNHSSGLMGTNYPNLALFADNEEYEHNHLLQQLKTQRLKADPGAYSVYCNDGFTLAEILVERVTGVSFTTYIANTITNPLKMNDTKTPVSKFDRDRLAKAYFPGTSKALPVENINMVGAGGIYSSAEDLCTFATTFTKNSNGILSKASMEAMENKEYLRGMWPKNVTDNSLGYGLGWDDVTTFPFNQYNIQALSKGGDTYFYHSNLTVLPDQNMAVAVVSSGGASTFDEVAAQQILLAALKEKGVIKEIKPDKSYGIPTERVKVPNEVKKYEGSYASPMGFLDIQIDQTGTLALSLGGMPEYATPYYYTKNGNFVSSDGSTSLKLVKEKNSKVYLEEAIYENLPFLGQVAIDAYEGQKETLNTLSGTIAKTWANRTGKTYYLLNEKYSSALYLLQYPNVQVGFVKGFEGYLGVDKITSSNSAVAILDGPGDMSRDLIDYKFYKKNNVEYLGTSEGSTYVDGATIKTLSTNTNFTSTIGKSGYANWYKIDSASAGKEITVTVPKNAGFVVYDGNGTLVNDSVITGVNKFTLPQNGTIAFVGNVQAKFTVKYSTSAQQ